MDKIKFTQVDAYTSPWSFSTKVKILLWDYVWLLCCKWTPKPLKNWRLFWLKLFGCKVYGKPFVHQNAVIRNPWNIILHDKSCIGDGAIVYALGEIEIGERATIAQEVYLSTGTHDFNRSTMDLITVKITVGSDVFVAARAFILPGVTIGEGAVIGACSVVTKDMPAWMVCAGNPCKPLKPREFKESE